MTDLKKDYIKNIAIGTLLTLATIFGTLAFKTGVKTTEIDFNKQVITESKQEIKANTVKIENLEKTKVDKSQYDKDNESLKDLITRFEKAIDKLDEKIDRK